MNRVFLQRSKHLLLALGTTSAVGTWSICEGKGGECPYDHKSQKAQKKKKESKCPYEGNTDSSNKVFNVYAQEIDPRNRVPYVVFERENFTFTVHLLIALTRITYS